jgi:hypothetical protein
VGAPAADSARPAAEVQCATGFLDLEKQVFASFGFLDNTGRMPGRRLEGSGAADLDRIANFYTTAGHVDQRHHVSKHLTASPYQRLRRRPTL